MAQLREGSVIKKSTGDEIIATLNDIPINTSDLTNDSGVLTSTGDINIEGQYKVNGIEGVSGTFQSQDGKTVTVIKGLITGIV